MTDDYPSQCADSAITPIPKSKGSLTEYGNYRGIAVGSILPKILSMILNTRGTNGLKLTINGPSVSLALDREEYIRCCFHFASYPRGIPI